MKSVSGDPSGFSDAAEQQVRDLLAAQPRPQMPPDVHARILAALAEQPAPQSRRPSSRSRLMWVGAAAAVVLLAGFVLVPQLRGPQGATDADTNTATATAPNADLGVPAAADCGAQPPVYDSGTRYQQAALVTQAAALVPAGCRTADAALAAQETGPTPTPMAAPAAGRTMECLVSVARSARVMVLDRGFYEDTRAIVAVVEPPRRALVVDCQAEPAQVLMDVELP